MEQRGIAYSVLRTTLFLIRETKAHPGNLGTALPVQPNPWKRIHNQEREITSPYKLWPSAAQIQNQLQTNLNRSHHNSSSVKSISRGRPWHYKAITFISSSLYLVTSRERDLLREQPRVAKSKPKEPKLFFVIVPLRNLSLIKEATLRGLDQFCLWTYL